MQNSSYWPYMYVSNLAGSFSKAKWDYEFINWWTVECSLYVFDFVQFTTPRGHQAIIDKCLYNL